MINIEELKIDNCAQNIVLKVGVIQAQAKFTRLSLWNEDSYKNPDKVVDLTYLLSQTDTEEDIIINAKKHLNKKSIFGIWFVELETYNEALALKQSEEEEDEEDILLDDKSEDKENKEDKEEETKEGEHKGKHKEEKKKKKPPVKFVKVDIVANIEPFRECILNKLIDLDIEDCNFAEQINCSDCNDNVLYLNTVLTTMIDLLRTQCYMEAIKMIKVLKDLCAYCDKCPEYVPSNHYIDGLTYGIKHNQLTLINDNECITTDDEDLRKYFISRLDY